MKMFRTLGTIVTNGTNNRLIYSVFRFLLSTFHGFFDLFFPPICPLCNAIIENIENIENNNLFCEECTSKLTTPAGMFCKRCGGKRLANRRNTFGCSRCRTRRFRFRRVIVLGEYEAELRELILRMKTDRNGFLARTVTQLLARQRAEELREANAEVIIPVPMYWWRRWTRGVNSPDILAEELGRILNIPVAAKRVRRIRPTDLQYMLSAHNRSTNVVNAFAMNKNQNRLKRFLSSCWNFWRNRQFKTGTSDYFPDLAGKKVLLVDDIFTTGSTCNEVAKVLRGVGVRSITVCAFARAVGFYTQHRTNLLENLAKKSDFS